MRCYRVHMEQIPAVYHSEVEQGAVIVGWEVGLACKSEGSPVNGLITLIRSIWSQPTTVIYTSKLRQQGLWGEIQSWKLHDHNIKKNRVACYEWVGALKTKPSVYPTHLNLLKWAQYPQSQQHHQPSHITFTAKLTKATEAGVPMCGWSCVQPRWETWKSADWVPAASSPYSLSSQAGIPHQVASNCRCYLRQIASTSPNLTQPL